MRVAIVSSESITDIDVSKLIPVDATELVIGQSTIVDKLIKEWTDENVIPRLLIQQSEVAVSISDLVIAVWDGKSSEVRQTIRYAYRIGKSVNIYIAKKTKPYSVIAMRLSIIIPYHNTLTLTLKLLEAITPQLTNE